MKLPSMLSCRMRQIRLFMIPVFLFILFSCEDKYENIHTYSVPYYISKSYPVYLDATAILKDIRVMGNRQPDNVFKMVADGEYIYAGEKKKGIHVFHKTGSALVQPVCFLECNEMKDFEVKEGFLYCNNFIDLLVADVRNPLETKTVHREKDFFNQFTDRSGYPKYDWQFPYIKGKGYQIAEKNVVLTGIETQDQPAPGFEAYDALYDNFIIRDIPDSLQVNLPCVGFIRGEKDIFTLGTYALATCNYAANQLTVNQISGTDYLNTTSPIRHLGYQDGVFFVLTSYDWTCFNYDSKGWSFGKPYTNWYLNGDPVGVSYIKNSQSESVAILNAQGRINRLFHLGDNAYRWDYSYQDKFNCILNVSNRLIALSDASLYVFDEFKNYEVMKVQKTYTDINGKCVLKQGNVLLVCNRQGISSYDISNLDNIKQIQ